MKKKDARINDKKQEKRENTLTAISGASGAMSFLGGWQICHNICLGIIALLSVIGITVVGMPLLFLTQYAVYFWSAAVIILIPTVLMYWKHKNHMSPKLIFLNIGIIIASMPFLQDYVLLFWIIGGGIIAYSIYLFAGERKSKRFRKC